MKKVVGHGDLAGGVLREGQTELLGAHSAPVVADPDQVASRLLNVDFDLFGAGVERVFDEFLHDARGAFDHFPRGDLVDKRCVENFNFRHGAIIPLFTRRENRQKIF